MEVEVRTHRSRRRRSDPAPPEISRPPNPRNWLIYAGLSALVAGLMFQGLLAHKAENPPLPKLAEPTDVRSAITPLGDSLQLVVSWDLTLSAPSGQADSIRVKVVRDPGQDSLVALHPGTEFADTSYFAAPAPGQTLTGRSCVAAQRADIPLVETCTPWQYVRPTVAEAAAAGVQRVVILPNGLQVDQDVGGRCAQWQRDHPRDPVWIVVNQLAIPACTGANGKPIVAQFCAFLVLADGRRIKAANSAQDPYCDELFVEWTRERYS